jgi:hypothetical protein
VYIESKEYSHLIDGTVDLYTFWMIDERLYERLEKLLIFVRIHTSFSYYSGKQTPHQGGVALSMIRVPQRHVNSVV